MRIHLAFAIAVAVVLPPLSAQTQIVMPLGTAVAEGSGSTSYPWGRGSLPIRVQYVYSAAHFLGQGVSGPILITRLRWRANGAAVSAGGTYGNVTIQLSTAAVPYGAVGSSFAGNHGASPATVYSGPVVIAPGAGTTPNNWYVDVVLTAPQAYDPTLGDLCVDIAHDGVGAPAGALPDAVASGSLCSRVYNLTSATETTGTVQQNLGIVMSVDFLGGGGGGTTGAVVINEFSYDDTGTDDREFVELYNRSGSPVDISFWQVESTDSGGLNSAYVIPAGTILPAGGFWVLGSALVPGVNQVVGSTNLWENDQESLALRDSTGTVVDSVVYEGYAGGALPGVGEGKPIFPEFLSTDGHDTSWSRLQDGFDTDNNGADFRLARATPGASGTGNPVPSYKENADAVPLGTALPGWWGSVVDPVAALPGTEGIGVSGQGGRVLKFPTNGSGTGHSFWYEATAQQGSFFRGEVYLDPTPAAAGQRRAWSIGVRGGTGSIYGMPDPNWSAGTDPNGDRGVAWTFVVTDSTATLYLIDNGDGGTDHVLLHQETITAPDWRVLGLHVTERRCVATLDTTCWHRAVHWTEGDFYVGSGASTQAGQRPLYLDDVCLQERGDQTNSQAQGCQGNCYQQNFAADTLDSGPTRERGPGRYAVYVDPQGGTLRATYFCLLSGSRTPQPNGATITVLDVALGGGPGAASQGPLPLRFHLDANTPVANQFGPGWWAADLGADFTRTTPFFVQFDLDANGYLPVAAKERDYEPATSDLWFHDGIAWSQTTQPRAWAWAFVCKDDAGDAQAETRSELTPGSTMRLWLRGGAATRGASFAFGIGVLGFIPIVLDLGFVGAPGCPLLVQPAANLFALTDALGSIEWAIPIPNSPAFLGVVLFSQWLPSSAGLNPLGIAATNRLRLQIQ